MEEITKEEAVRALMISFASLHYGNLSVTRVLTHGVNYLVEQYQQTGEERFMELARLQVVAYVCLGFSLPQDGSVGGMVLDEEMRSFVQRYGRGREVRLCSSQVRTLIGKWMPSKAMPLRKSDVVEDILKKAAEKKEGTYTYTYRRSGASKKSLFSENRYELVIADGECFFWNLTNFRFYHLVAEED